MKYIVSYFSRLVLSITLCFWVLKVNAQAPPIQWEECLGGSATDEAYSIQRTKDSGYIIAGYTNSTDDEVTGNHGPSDYWVVKLSSAGTMLWEKALGGSGSDLANSVMQTNDNGYIVAGYSNSNDSEVSGNHGGWDYWVVKLNDTGGIQWQKSLGGDTTDIPKSIIQTSDSGYIVAGASSSNDGDVTGNHGAADCWIVKLSSSGNIQWENSYGGSGGDGGVSIKQTLDTGYIVACSSNSADGDVTGNHGDYDVWILKLSPSGTIEWEKSYGGSGTDYADAIQLTSDSGYIVAGSSNSADGDVTGNHGGFDYWVLKLSSSGNIQWENSFGGSNDEFATSVQQTSNHGYIVAGITFSDDSEVAGFIGESDMWIIKLTASGALSWQKCLGGSSYDGAESIQQISDSSYIIAGYTSSADSEVTGYIGGTDYWIVKLGYPADTMGTDTTKTGISSINNNVIISVIPNPASAQVIVEASEKMKQIVIINSIGQTVFSHSYDNKKALINIADLPVGIYFVKVNDSETGKFIKE